MSNHEDSQPGRQRSANGGTSTPLPDDATGIRIGIAVQVFGGHLAEHFRVRRHLTQAQRAAASAKLVEILSGISGELDTLKIGLRAMAREDLG